MRNACRRPLAALLLGMWCARALAGTSSVLSRERPVIQYVSPGRWRRGRNRTVPRDPVPALGEGELGVFKGGLTRTEIKQLLDGYLDRMTSCYAEEYGFPETLIEFLNRDRTVREVFVSALNPRYDDIRRAARIFEELRAEDERRLVKYVHLAAAIAVVYDTPDAALSSRYWGIWGMGAGQFPEPPEYEQIYDYYTKPSNRMRFAFSVEKLPWPILVHLVDNDASPEERHWAARRYSPRTSIAKLYPSVPYDYDKLNRRGSKLGERPYVLANLLQYGGVCGDQAHFTTRVAKGLGTPAMKVRGEGRYGGRHGWAGFLVVRKGRPLLEFTGRYLYDYYYTGDVFDPQTRTVTLDRYVAMMYDGASLSYPKYNRSQMLVRMAEAMIEDHPKESLAVTKEALKLNYFNMWGWPLLMEHMRKGTVSKKDGLKWFNDCLRVLKDHPDMTFECLNTFKDCLPEKDVKGRQSLYNQAFAVYRSRPDLQLKLRIAQAEELVAVGMKLQALNVLAPTIVKNAKEGTLVLPAMRKAVELALALHVERQACAMLLKADAGFPKMRGNTPSEAYAEFKGLLDQLRGN